LPDTPASKLNLWYSFIASNRIDEESVPLFASNGDMAATMPYGHDGRLVLRRSMEMDSLMRQLGKQLIEEFRNGEVTHDGILYLMFRREPRGVVPLYFGKAEIYGKGDANLSANISDLASGDGKFGRWGYNYAYHIGDLSAVTLDGHPGSKRTRKYEAWRRALFCDADGSLKMNGEVRFWACLWGPERKSIWREYGTTRLAFEEYLLIGVASDLYPNELLNREGRNKLELTLGS
jgi:hypothetical protein